MTSPSELDIQETTPANAKLPPPFAGPAACEAYAELCFEFPCGTAAIDLSKCWLPLAGQVVYVCSRYPRGVTENQGIGNDRGRRAAVHRHRAVLSADCTTLTAEPNAAPDRGGTEHLQGSRCHPPPQQMSGVVRPQRRG